MTATDARVVDPVAVRETAERMVRNHGAKAREWANLHACSYDSHEFGFRYWSAVADALDANPQKG